MPTTYAIPQGSQYMQADIYNGNNGTTDTLYDFAPGMVWYKCRSNGSTYHYIFDTVRGANNAVYPNLTSAENAEFPTYNTQSFVTNGSRIVYNGGDHLNASGRTYVNWAWKAGSTVTNNVGSISSQVSTNATAGFSIVTYTGNGVISTIGHGLGVAPAMMIIKARNAAQGWLVYHQSIGNTGFVYLNDSAIANYSINGWNNTSPTSTVFTTGVNGYTNASGQTQVAYCWAQVAGFSQFGGYTGNGSTDGPFIYTGFRPRFIMYKATSGTAYYWSIYDTVRDTYNAPTKLLYPNVANAEDSPYLYMDILSNGFKIRAAGNLNENGSNYIYAAFAENPFKYANAR